MSRARITPKAFIITKRIEWNVVAKERYCVRSKRPVQFAGGERCIRHGNEPEMCKTKIRPAQCKHPYISPNHPYPKCSECGNVGRHVETR